MSADNVAKEDQHLSLETCADSRPRGKARRAVHPADDTEANNADPETHEASRGPGSRGKRIRGFLHRNWLAPQTTFEIVVCCTTWLLVLGALLVLFILGLPRLACAAFVPLLAWVKAHLKTFEVVLIALAGLSVFPLFFCPIPPFIWLISAVLGVKWAALVVTAGTAVGMTLPFLISKRFIMKTVNRWMTGKPWLEALLLAVQEVGAFKVVFLMRLGPVPYDWFNYGAAISKDVTYWPYILGSVLGQAPHNTVNILIGKSVRNASSLCGGNTSTEHHRLQTASMVLTLLAAAVIGVLGYVFAKRALHKIHARAAATQAILPRIVVVTESVVSTGDAPPDIDVSTQPNGARAEHAGLALPDVVEPELQQQESVNGGIDSESARLTVPSSHTAMR